MRAFYNMAPHEFLSQVRDALIRVNAGPCVIDQCDALRDAVENADLNDKDKDDAIKALDKMENERDHYRTALQCLVNDMEAYGQPNDTVPKEYAAAIRAAQKALDEEF